MSRKPRQNRIKLDPHFFEASPAMLASDDDLVLGRFDDEMNDEGWWSDVAAEARMSTRRKMVRRNERRAMRSRLDDWDLMEARFRN